MSISELKKEAKIRIKGVYFRLFAMFLTYTIITFFLTTVINGIVEALPIFSLNLILSLLLLLIDVPMGYGVIVMTLKAVRGEDFKLLDFLVAGFKSFGKIWKTSLRLFVRLLFPAILTMVTYVLFFIFVAFYFLPILANMPGAEAELVTIASALPSVSLSQVIVFGLLFLAASIYFFVKNLLYAPFQFVLKDNEDLTATEVINKSRDLMKGHRCKYFLIGLSFILYFIGIIFLFMFTAVVNPLFSITVTFIATALLTPYITSTQICFYEELKEENNKPVENKDAE